MADDVEVIFTGKHDHDATVNTESVAAEVILCFKRSIFVLFFLGGEYPPTSSLD